VGSVLHEKGICWATWDYKGGLAGVCCGLGLVTEQWRSTMARAKELESLFEKLAGICHLA